MKPTPTVDAPTASHEETLRTILHVIFTGWTITSLSLNVPDFRYLRYARRQRKSEMLENFSSIESQGFYIVVSLLSCLPQHQLQPMPTALNSIAETTENVNRKRAFSTSPGECHKAFIPLILKTGVLKMKRMIIENKNLQVTPSESGFFISTNEDCPKTYYFNEYLQGQRTQQSRSKRLKCNFSRNVSR